MSTVDFKPQTADFTEARYAEIIAYARQRFRFSAFGAEAGDGCVALWRHDIDMSPHRALKLARLEADQGVRSTWFVMLRSTFYSLFESETAALVSEIGALGHDIGLHFESPSAASSLEEVETSLAWEAGVLADLLKVPILSFSTHNPTVRPDLNLAKEQHAGLINASAPPLYETYTYCSDSNGIWRFRPLGEVIADPNVTQLYALTHPVWWTPEEMVPRQRVARAIEGRARSVAASYDTLLSAHNRPNVGHGET